MKAICAGVVAVAAFAAATGVVRGKDLYYALQNRGDLGPLSREDIEYIQAEAPQAASADGVVSAEEWKAVYPEIAVSMGDNAKNELHVSYLEESPYLVNIYEGYGFAKDYESARGHSYTLEDVAATERPHATANCLTCKSPNFTKLVNDQGVGVYTMDFNEVHASLNESISCYNCHENSAGTNGQLGCRIRASTR